MFLTIEFLQECLKRGISARATSSDEYTDVVWFLSWYIDIVISDYIMHLPLVHHFPNFPFLFTPRCLYHAYLGIIKNNNMYYLPWFNNRHLQSIVYYMVSLFLLLLKIYSCTRQPVTACLGYVIISLCMYVRVYIYIASYDLLGMECSDDNCIESS